MFVVKVFCGYLLSLSVCLIGYLCLSPSFSYHSPDVSHSAQGVCEHLYNEAMLNNRSVAQCDRRTGLQGNMYLHKCICTQTCKQNEGTLLKGDNLPVSPPVPPSPAVCCVYRSSVSHHFWQRDRNLHNEQGLCAVHRSEASLNSAPENSVGWRALTSLAAKENLTLSAKYSAVLQYILCSLGALWQLFLVRPFISDQTEESDQLQVGKASECIQCFYFGNDVEKPKAMLLNTDSTRFCT